MKKRNSRNRLLPKPSEHQIQVAFVQWWEVFAKTKGLDPRLGFAIPNGGDRHPAVAAKLKAEGVKAGVLDFFIAIPRGQYHGLFIEFKSANGRLSDGQREMVLLFKGQYYAVMVCRSVDEAMLVVADYLTLEPEIGK